MKMDEEVSNQNTGEYEQEELIITVQNEQGRSFDCTILTTFEAGERAYIALLPHDPDKDGNITVQLFRYTEIIQDGQEGIEIIPIRSDMEFEAALSAFETLIEEA